MSRYVPSQPRPPPPIYGYQPSIRPTVRPISPPRPTVRPISPGRSPGRPASPPQLYSRSTSPPRAVVNTRQLRPNEKKLMEETRALAMVIAADSMMLRGKIADLAEALGGLYETFGWDADSIYGEAGVILSSAYRVKQVMDRVSPV
jgi:riboflavin biosynthesis pyrimidine reductase